MADEEQHYIIMTGGPQNGLRYYGPYSSATDAMEDAEKHNLQDNWWITPLEDISLED